MVADLLMLNHPSSMRSVTVKNMESTTDSPYFVYAYVGPGI